MHSQTAPVNTDDIPIPDRVAAGIALLESPLAGCAHALDRIDTDTLDMISVHHDVLGQIYGTFAAGISQLGLTEDQARAHGLDVHDDEADDVCAEWIRQLVAMRTAPLPVRKAA